ncbi:MAG: AAA family ATPase [Bacteroidota bacterium]|nr:AAA family ATPase [Bacteroidota bacterium]
MSADTVFIPRPEIEESLEEALRRCRANVTQYVWVFGDMGQGKTSALRHAILRLRDTCYAGYAAFRAPVGNHSVSALNPYQTLKDVVEDMLAGQRDSQKYRNLVKNISLTILACIPFVGDVAYGIKELRRDWNEFKRGERLVRFDRFVEEYFETLRNLSREMPLLLVLDDIQWADAQTISLLDRFFSEHDLAATRMVWVFVGRPAEFHLVPELTAFRTKVGGSAQSMDIEVRPFSEPLIRAYVAARFPQRVPEARLVEWLARRTGGNPFFLHSYVQQLLVEGILTREGDIAGDLEAFGGMPVEIRAVTDWIMRVLPEDDLTIMLTASVLGYEFSLHELSHLMKRPVLDLIRALRRIAKVHGICEPVGYRLVNGMESTVYRFSQHAIHTALYNELTVEEREALHRSTALYLNRLRLEGGNDPTVLGSIASALMLHARLGKQPDIELESILLKARNATEPFDVEHSLEHIRSLAGLIGRPLEDIESAFRRSLMDAPLATHGPEGKNVVTAEEESGNGRDLAASVMGIVDLLRRERVEEAREEIRRAMGREEERSIPLHPLFSVLEAIALSKQGKTAQALEALRPALIADSAPAYRALARVLEILFSPAGDDESVLEKLREVVSYEGRYRDLLRPLVFEVVRSRFSGRPEFGPFLRQAGFPTETGAGD